MPAESPRIVFAGTPDFAARHLEGLISLGHKPVAVYSQPDRPAGRGKKIQPTPVKSVAARHGIPVFQPVKLDNPAMVELAALAPDVLIVVAYGLILSQAVLSIARFGCINVHASLLPRWRGAAPIERAILAGDTETGVTIMQMDAGLDTGDILLALSTPITDTDNAATVSDRLVALGIQGLDQVLQDLPGSQAGAVKQDTARACYAPKLGKDDARINWSAPALAVQHQVQAFFPRSPAWCWFRGDRLRVITGRRIAGNQGAAPGTILKADADGLLVACGSDSLLIESVQLPGKVPATFRDLLNGHPDLFVPGVRLDAQAAHQ